jgi:hypothetical protein
LDHGVLNRDLAVFYLSHSTWPVTVTYEGWVYSDLWSHQDL